MSSKARYGDASNAAFRNGARNGASRNSYEPLPPANQDAERFLLGAVLANPDLFPQTSEVEPHYFTLDRHRMIFQRMRDIHGRGEEIKYTSVYLEMQAHHETDATLLSYLVDLPEGIPAEKDLGGYVRKVRQAAVQRGMFFAAHKQMLQAAHPADDLEFILSDSQNELAQLATLYQNGSHPVSRLERLPSVWRANVEMKFVVSGLILEGALTMLSGQAGDGKSTFCLELAGCVALGKPFLDRLVKQRPVLYMDRENPIYVVKDRLMRLGIPETPHLKIWGNWWEGNPPPGPEDPEIVEFARQQPLIIFDSLVAFARCDENSSQEMRRHLELYKKLCYLGASVMFIHHASDKAETLYRGSSDIKAAIDAALHLSRADGSGSADALNLLALEEFKTRGMVGGKIRLEFRDNGFHALDAPRPSPMDVLKELVRLHPGATRRELVKLAQPFKVARRVVVDTLGRADVSGEIQARPGKGHTIHHYLPDAPNAQEKLTT